MGASATRRRGIGAATRVTKMVLFRLIGRSDYERWTDPNGLEAWWESRTQKLAEMVPLGTRVIEFGAGRRKLAGMLDASCTYVASDLVDRGSDTFVCDLNRRPLPDLAALRPDVAVFAGVLEYVRDVPAVLEWLSAHVKYCVASYEIAQPASLGGGLVAGARRTYWRAYHGYMNSYSEAEFLGAFSRSRFACLRTESWNDQRLFLFEQHRGETRP